MDVKEYLSQTFTLNCFIESKKSRIQRLRDMCEVVTGGIQPNRKVQTNLKRDPVGELTAKILEAEETCLEEIIRLMSLQHEIEMLIESVPHPDYRLILQERYVNLKSWDDIVENTSYSTKWVHVLHRRGLDAIEKVYTKICSRKEDICEKGNFTTSRSKPPIKSPVAL